MFESNLYEILNKKNMTLLDLYKETGINRERLKQLAENSLKKISLNEIDILCNCLNCKPSDLFYHKKE